LMALPHFARNDAGWDPDEMLRRALEAIERQREIEGLNSPPMPEYEPGYLEAWIKEAERYFAERI